MPDVVNPISPPQFAGAPYGDAMEVTGPPVLITIPEEFGPFLRTDARTVMITLQPHHFNYIPNPSFRTDTAGWALTGSVWDGRTADYVLTADPDGAVNKTAIEDILALPAPDGSTILVEHDGSYQSLLVEAGQTLSVADARFPLSADVSGCRDWQPLTDSLDAEISWVGRSIVISGEGILHYRDRDSEGGEAFVYVGPEYEFDASGQGDWRAYSRGSPEWTFTAHVRGRGRVRMVMEAYRAEGVMGPVQGLNIPVVADPSAQPFDRDTPRYLEEGTGALYELRPAPYYNNLWRPITVADPAALTDQQQPLVLDGSGNLWRPITPPPAALPLYENVGTPTVVDHMPLTDDPTDPYLIVQESPPNPETDGFVWRVNGPPYYELAPTGATASAIGSVFTPWVEIGGDGAPETEWQRLLVRTSARVGEDGVNFSGCHWIDARLEFEGADGLYISSLMLDSTEHPVAPYFDGGMTEDADRDDFLWSEQAQPDNCISFYYRDRVARMQWLEQNMRFLVPVSRPVQFFYNDWSRPHGNQSPAPSRTARAKSFTI